MVRKSHLASRKNTPQLTKRTREKNALQSREEELNATYTDVTRLEQCTQQNKRPMQREVRNSDPKGALPTFCQVQLWYTSGKDYASRSTLIKTPLRLTMDLFQIDPWPSFSILAQFCLWWSEPVVIREMKNLWIRCSFQLIVLIHT